jgi:hypothetical protein
MYKVIDSDRSKKSKSNDSNLLFPDFSSISSSSSIDQSSSSMLLTAAIPQSQHDKSAYKIVEIPADDGSILSFNLNCNSLPIVTNSSDSYQSIHIKCMKNHHCALCFGRYAPTVSTITDETIIQPQKTNKKQNNNKKKSNLKANTENSNIPLSSRVESIVLGSITYQMHYLCHASITSGMIVISFEKD